MSVIKSGIEGLCRKFGIEIFRRSQWSRCLRRGPAADRLLGSRFRIPNSARKSVSCECCTLSLRSLCGGLIIRSEETYRVRSV